MPNNMLELYCENKLFHYYANHKFEHCSLERYASICLIRSALNESLSEDFKINIS